MVSPNDRLGTEVADDTDRIGGRSDEDGLTDGRYAVGLDVETLALPTKMPNLAGPRVGFAPTSFTAQPMTLPTMRIVCMWSGLR